ncbi:MAG: c-type cytochrome [Polyangiaceae bacterium]|nr:c-type cytochrome [Polyangiaceae bacterium]
MGACGDAKVDSGATSTSASGVSSTATPAVSAVNSQSPDPKRGAALLTKFECWRCHEGTTKASTIPVAAPVEPTPEAMVKADNQHCFDCHRRIIAGSYKAPKPSTTERWKKNVEALVHVPSLTGAHRRFKRSWIEGFLAKPHDLRPRLSPTMPKLPLSPTELRDLAAFLVPEEKPSSPPTITKAAVAEGRALFENKGCPSCHFMTGTGSLKGNPAKKADEKGLSDAQRLAPDLRFARDRMAFETIVTWVRKPQSIKEDTAMPETPMSEEEAQKIATFIIGEELSPIEPQKIPTRLPVLTRQVSYEELKNKLFNKICWHCHSDADYAIGDGGPGNTGGFGFVPRGLNLAAYDGILSGSTDDKGELRSIFEPMPDGTPRLVAALLARWKEEAGGEDTNIRGMPLGMPALSPEDVQLVETWVAQGHSPD